MAADRPAAGQPGWARDVTRLAVLTGAGISTDSGIPDFRGPSGVWTRNPEAEKLSTYQAYMSDPELRRRSWQNRLAHPAWDAEPNPAHLALAELAASAIDTQVITQNIDGLHQRAGTPPGQVIELHGAMSGVVADSVRFCFEMVAEGTTLQGARLDISQPPARFRPLRCGAGELADAIGLAAE